MGTPRYKLPPEDSQKNGSFLGKLKNHYQRFRIPILIIMILFIGIYIVHRINDVDNLKALDENLDLSPEEKLEFIDNNPSFYPEDLQELAHKNEEAISYVFYYPKESRKKDIEDVENIDISEDVEKADSAMPLFLQWDPRWGYKSYGSGLVGYTGCGPTCLSMVAVYLTGNQAYNPGYIAKYAEEQGYWYEGGGTAWALLTDGCVDFGLKSTTLEKKKSTMIASLEKGEPIICSMGPGDFTDKGHFIVVTGYKDGKFTIHDPNSNKRSEKKWSYKKLKGQIKAMWAFGKK